MSIALTARHVPRNLADQIHYFSTLGVVLVRKADLDILERDSKTSPRAQQDSAPVAQHLTTEQPPTDPALTTESTTTLLLHDHVFKIRIITELCP